MAPRALSQRLRPPPRWFARRSAAPASHGPRPRDEIDRAIGRDGKRGANALAQRHAALFAQAHRVGRPRTLATQERTPEVVEIAEPRRHVDRSTLDSLEAAFSAHHLLTRGSAQ